jgi:hypothetical protein
MEQGMKVASVVSLARIVGAWTILSAVALSFGVQLLAGFGESRTENWSSAELCRSAPAPEPNQSRRIDAHLAANP